MSEEKYLQRTYFEEIYGIFLLDSELRNLFMKEILGLENSLKSYVARIFSEKYGHAVIYFQGITIVQMIKNYVMYIIYLQGYTG